MDDVDPAATNDVSLSAEVSAWMPPKEDEAAELTNQADLSPEVDRVEDQWIDPVKTSAAIVTQETDPTPEADEISSPKESMNIQPACSPLPRTDSIRHAPSSETSDRLSEIFTDLVHSALDTQVNALIGQLDERVEERMSEMERTAFASLEQKMNDAADSCGVAIEQHAVSVVTKHQASLEQNTTKIQENAEANARAMHQQLVNESRDSMQNQLNGMSNIIMNQLQEQSSEILTSTQAKLSQRIDLELAVLEEKISRNGQAIIERQTKTQNEIWEASFQSQIENGSQRLRQMMDSQLTESGEKFAAELEARMEQIRMVVTSSYELQIEQIGARVRQKFLQHIVAELGRNQQTWILQAQREFENAADRNLHRSHQELSQMMKQLGETISNQASQIGAPRIVGSESVEEQAHRETAMDIVELPPATEPVSNIPRS